MRSDTLRADPRIEEAALTTSVALRAATLGAEGFHRDPADRLISATARERAALLVTRDEAMRRHDLANTIW